MQTQRVDLHFTLRLEVLWAARCIDRFFGATIISTLSVQTENTVQCGWRINDNNLGGERMLQASISWKLSRITFHRPENDITQNVPATPTMLSYFFVLFSSLSPCCLGAFMIVVRTFVPRTQRDNKKSISQDILKASLACVSINI